MNKHIRDADTQPVPVTGGKIEECRGSRAGGTEAENHHKNCTALVFIM